jgi:trans-aconitate methyltransferase
VRYPEVVLARVVEGLGPRPRIVDVGAGTGIVLEGLLPLLTDPSVHAFDLSADMVALGQDKFPEVTWAAGRGEGPSEASRTSTSSSRARRTSGSSAPRS